MREKSQNQRTVRLFLIEEGMRLVANAPGPARGVLPEALKRLPDEALEDLNKSLSVLLDAIALRDDEAAFSPDPFGFEQCIPWGRGGNAV